MLNLKSHLMNEERELIWFHNINQEQIWNENRVFPSITDRMQLELVKQQEQQVFFIANQNDTIILRHQPDPQFLAYLYSNGYVSTKKIINIADGNIPWKDFKKDSIFVPYINTEEYECQARGNLITLFGASSEIVKLINDKYYTRRLAMDYGFPVTRGFFCYNIDQLNENYEILKREGFEKVVIKIPYGSSGKGLKILNNLADFNVFSSYIKRRAISFELLIEGWHSIDRSLNAQLLIEKDNFRVLSITEQKIDSGGVYLGTDFNPAYSKEHIMRYMESLNKLGTILLEKGYTGIAGVDSILDANANLIPIIEINARFTQVTYMLPIVGKLAKKYRYIESRFIRISTDYSFSFDEMHEVLINKLEPNHRNNFLVYTFAKINLDKTNAYRVFLLFYGEDKEIIEIMMERFTQIEFKIK